MRGYCGIGIYHNKNKRNIGTLWRSAYLFNASFVFTIQMQYKWQPSDTYKTWRHLPFFHYENENDFLQHIPHDSKIIGVELTEEATDIAEYKHPERCVYLLGAEDTGLPPELLALCHQVIKLPGKYSMNVSTAGSIVLYDRFLKDAKNPYFKKWEQPPVENISDTI
jgi:tRNA G18 (ribose-2'-O)-methylase SpoU